ncbi:MAG: hypothetical protein AB7F43_10150 [Bacteriovoracia bacterium]
MRVLILIFILLFSGCGRNGNLYDLFEQYEHTAPKEDGAPPMGIQNIPYGVIVEGDFPYDKNKPTPIDIIFSIDNSGSMDPFIQAVEDNIKTFVGTLEKNKVDFQIGFVKSTENNNGAYDSSFVGPYKIVKSTDSNVEQEIQADIETIRRGDAGGNERGVWILEQAIHNGSNFKIFRNGSFLSLMVLTDAIDDYYDNAGNISSTTQNLLRIFNAISTVGMTLVSIGSPSSNPCPTAENPSQPLLEALTMATSQKMGRICDSNYSSILEEAASSIVKQANGFDLSGLVPGDKDIDPESVEVFVNGKLIPDTSFLVTSGSKRLTFVNSYTPPDGATIHVRLAYVEP